MEIGGLNRDSIEKWRVGQLKGQGPFPPRIKFMTSSVFTLIFFHDSFEDNIHFQYKLCTNVMINPLNVVCIKDSLS